MFLFFFFFVFLCFFFLLFLFAFFFQNKINMLGFLTLVKVNSGSKHDAFTPKVALSWYHRILEPHASRLYVLTQSWKVCAGDLALDLPRRRCHL